MKIIIERNKLIEKLKIANLAIAPKSTLLILSNVLLRGNKDTGKLTIAATNLEIGIIVQVDAQIEKDFAVTMPAKTLEEIVKTLDEWITIDYNPKTRSFEIESGKSKSRIKGIDADEFPTLLTENFVAQTYVNGADLQSVFAKTLVCVSNDQGRPALTGINMQITGNVLFAQSADGFRLARTFVAAKGEEFNAIIPANAAKVLKSIINDNTVEIMTVKVDKKVTQIAFRQDDFMLFCSVIMENYPNLLDIINQAYSDVKTTMLIAKNDLLRVIKNVRVFIPEAGDIIFEITPPTDGEGKIALFSENEFGNASNEAIGVVTGSAIRFGMRYSFIADCINAIKSPNVIIKLKSPRHPVILEPSEMTVDNNTIFICMPMIVEYAPPIVNAEKVEETEKVQKVEKTPEVEEESAW